MFPKYQRIGILKGGQLGRMLIQSCINYGMLSYVLDIDPQAPCRHYCTEFTLGDANSVDDVFNFGKKVDLLTLEFENVNIEALRKLKAAGIPVTPDPEPLAIIQDKGLQKEFFTKNHFPTAPYVLVKDKNEIANHKDFIPGVQKIRRAGYDGRGVKVIKSEADIADGLDGPSVLEKKIDIQTEIAVVAARNTLGETATFPVVEMAFHPGANLLDFLYSPANIPQPLQDKARELALEIAKKLGIVGVLAVEMFVSTKGELLVNEIAPRPHNSGHHTIEANVTSQYDQHIRAVLGLSLGSTDAIKPAVMVNLLGSEGHKGPAAYEGIEELLKIPGAYLHLYGKAVTSPNRKMGHVTLLDDSLEKAKEKAKWVKQNVRVVSR